MLAINNISKNYKSVRAVNNISLNVKTGDIYGFLGPNGAGKTTTIRMIMGIIKPDTGNIKIFDNNQNILEHNMVGYLLKIEVFTKNKNLVKLSFTLACCEG